MTSRFIEHVESVRNKAEEEGSVTLSHAEVHKLVLAIACAIGSTAIDQINDQFLSELQSEVDETVQEFDKS